MTKRDLQDCSFKVLSSPFKKGIVDHDTGVDGVAFCKNCCTAVTQTTEEFPERVLYRSLRFPESCCGSIPTRAFKCSRSPCQRSFSGYETQQMLFKTVLKSVEAYKTILKICFKANRCKI